MYDFYQKDGFGYIIPNGTIFITDCPKNMKRLEIPSQIDGIPVTALYQSALDYTINTSYISLPEGIVEIGEEAFSHSGVEEIKLPSSLKLIKKYAFKDCSNLKEITLPDHTAIQIPLFMGCRSLNKINVSAESDIFVSIDGVLFTKDDMKLVEYPQGKKDAVYTLPKETTAIMPGAFMQNTFLETVILSNVLEDICAYAFAGCLNLRKIEFGNSVKNIGDFAFAQCAIEHIDMPKSIVQIGNNAFANCPCSNK